jgi:hypothetical protein
MIARRQAVAVVQVFGGRAAIIPTLSTDNAVLNKLHPDLVDTPTRFT